MLELPCRHNDPILAVDENRLERPRQTVSHDGREA